MLSVRGIYENNDVVKLKEKVSMNGGVPVIVTFLEDVETQETKRLNLDEFSFRRSKEILKNYKGSLSDAVIEERRSFL